MSIVITRTVPVINGFVQNLPNRESEKTADPVAQGDWPNLIRLSNNPLRSDTYLKYEEEVVQ